MENKFKTRITTLFSDNGGEFIALKEFLSSSGITHLTTPPHTPEHNGLSERRHRHIVETGLSLLTHSSIPNTFWTYAFSTVVYLINWMPTPILFLQSPFQNIFTVPPNYLKLRTFGSLCFPWLRPYNSNKLEIITLCLPRLLPDSECLPLLWTNFSTNLHISTCSIQRNSLPLSIAHLTTKFLLIFWPLWCSQQSSISATRTAPWRISHELGFFAVSSWVFRVYFFSIDKPATIDIHRTRKHLMGLHLTLKWIPYPLWPNRTKLIWSPTRSKYKSSTYTTRISSSATTKSRLSWHLHHRNPKHSTCKSTPDENSIKK